MWTAVAQIAGTVQGRAVALLAELGDLWLAGAFPPDVDLGVTEMGAARWSYERGELAGRRREVEPRGVETRERLGGHRRGRRRRAGRLARALSAAGARARPDRGRDRHRLGGRLARAPPPRR